MKNLLAVAMILCLIAGGVGFYFYSEVLTPLAEEEETIKKEISDLEKKEASLKNIDKEIVKLKENNRKLEEKKKELQTDFNKLSTVVPMLLASTETISNKFKVKFQDIRISPLVRAEDWNELPIELIVQGTFQNIGSFLKIMELRKIVNLADGAMSVSVSAELDSKTKSPLLSVTLSAKVYIMDSM